MRQFRDMPSIVFREQLGDRLIKVPAKTVRHLFAANIDLAGDRGKERIGSYPRRFWNSSRISGVQFCPPTSQLSIWVATSVRPASGPAASISFFMIVAKCRSMRRLAQFVALKAVASEHRGPGARARRGFADSLDRPFPGRHVPGEVSVRGHLRRQVDDLVARHAPFTGLGNASTATSR